MSKETVLKHGKREVFVTFLLLGSYAFGGPTAHFALFRRSLAERRGWLSPTDYDAYLALCQFLPGPGSSQMAAVLGWVRAGFWGAVLAMTAFALPSVALMTVAGVAVTAIDPAQTQGAVTGLLAAVAAVVGAAVWAMLRTAAQQLAGLVLSAASALGVLAASGAGLQVIWLQPILIGLAACAGVGLIKPSAAPQRARIRVASAKVGLTAFVLFTALLLALPFSSEIATPFVLADIAYRSGALVFGGGHVVLPLLKAGVAPDLVTEAAFLAGYGLAQAVPGPIFSFAAFLGAASGDTAPQAIGLALLTAAMLFLPGLLLVFAVLPAWTRIQARPRAQSAIKGAAAGATGLLAAAFIDPVVLSLPVDLRAYGLALGGFMALKLAKAPSPLVIAACALVGAFLF